MNETTRLLRDLVTRPSINPMGRPLQGPEFFEYQVTAYLDDYFRSLGVPYERQTIAPLRDNIVARYDAPGSRRTVVFEVHQDTVPVDGMIIDPFGAKIENGRLYGRGACDIKGGMAAMLWTFTRLVREKPRTACNLILACTVDEELTFLGVQELVKRGIKADAAVVAEPTQLQIVHAHKGAVRWDVRVRGKACHSSRPDQGVNAIYHMARVLPVIERYALELQQSRIDPLLGSPTLSVGRISGGVSVNTVPDACSVEIDRRLLPGEKGGDAVAEFRAFLQRHVPAGVEYEVCDPWLSSLALSPDGSEELVERLGVAIDSVVGKHTVHAVAFGTDASKLAAGGIPSVVFGPGDIARAHTCDEWVPLDEVEQASEILFRFACQE
jgi:acetylornithine deacetylase